MKKDILLPVAWPEEADDDLDYCEEGSQQVILENIQFVVSTVLMHVVCIFIDLSAGV